MAKAADIESISLNVFVTPKAGTDAVDGWQEADAGRELRVRVRAVPDEGKANKAVCAVIAKFIRVPKTAVTVEAGTTSRHKRLRIEGLSEEDLESRLSVLE